MKCQGACWVLGLTTFVHYPLLLFCSRIPAVSLRDARELSTVEGMATTASLPAYLLQGVTIHQPTHLEGDPALATEILPGPPSLVSAQQAAQKRDPRKPSTVYSYLPLSDPGSTYSGLMHGTLIGQDLEGPRNKRSRVDKGYVFVCSLLWKGMLNCKLFSLFLYFMDLFKIIAALPLDSTTCSTLHPELPRDVLNGRQLVIKEGAHQC